MTIRPFIEPDSDDPCHGPEDTTCPSCGLGKSWDEFNAYARELGRRAGKRHVPPKTDEQADHDWHRYCDEWTVKED